MVITAMAAGLLAAMLGAARGLPAPVMMLLPVLALFVVTGLLGTMGRRLAPARLKRGLWGCLLGLVAGAVLPGYLSSDGQGPLLGLLTAPAGVLVGATLGLMLPLRS
jgi:hypothetical protein